MDNFCDRIKSTRIWSFDDIDKIKSLLHKKLNIDSGDIIINHARKKVIIKRTNIYYEIRLSDHICSSSLTKEKNRFKYTSIGLIFIIKVSIAKYTLYDIVNAIQHIETSYKYFNSERNVAKIKCYIDEYEDRAIEKEEDRFMDRVLYSHTIAMDLAGVYMKNNDIVDDEYNSVFLTLSSVFERELDTL